MKRLASVPPAGWIGIGAGIGTALGVGLGNIAIGIAIGTALGVVAMAILTQRA